MDWQEVIERAVAIIEHNMETLQDFPELCSGPMWTPIRRERGDRAHWVDGFWTGLLWLAYAHTEDPAFERGAREWTERLRWLKTSTSTHDLGFIFYLSHVLGGRITGDPSYFPHAVEAAHTLVKRYNVRGEYLQAWGEIDGTVKDRGRTNIDVMMNLALLYWASEYSGDPDLGNIATQHARTTRLVLVRRDGSTAHVADFDPETGIWLRRDTHQGFAHDSCWSRGQAWALYGFTTCYAATGIPCFLETARVLAEYTFAHLPDDLVPFWDYDSPDIPNTYRDSSAAAATACGLLELARVEPDRELAHRWRDWAERITISLWENYSSRGTDIPALLLHGSRSVPHGYMDHALIYGDYYFFEAVTRLARPDLADRAFPTPGKVSPQTVPS